MNRTVAFLAGVVTLGVAIYFGIHLGARPAHAQSPGQGQPRIGVVNLNFVIKNYKKFQYYQEENKREWKTQFEGQVLDLQKKREEWVKYYQNPQTTAEQRENAQKTIKQIERQLQDLNEEAKNRLGKKQADQLTILYKDLRDAVRTYAQRAGLELVMHYSDALQIQDLDSNANIQRKMMADACMPLYMADGVDITKPVLEMLNQSYQPAVTPASATGQQPAPRQ